MRYSGIDTRRVVLRIYVLSALLSAVAGFGKVGGCGAPSCSRWPGLDGCAPGCRRGCACDISRQCALRQGANACINRGKNSDKGRKMGKAVDLTLDSLK